jgi:hypothetical protein
MADSRTVPSVRGEGVSRVNERGLAAADRAVRLLRQLGIERAYMVQGEHPEALVALHHRVLGSPRDPLF